MKDELTKRILKHRRSELRRLTFSLRNVKWTIGAIVVMIVCFIVSYFFRNTWISNVLISVGAGFVTGLVFYWLSNLRNNKIIQLENEIDTLTPVYKDLENIANLQLLAKIKSMEQYSKKSQENIACEIMESLDRLVLSIHKITTSSAENLNLRNEDPFSYDSYQAFRKSYEKTTTSDECRAWSKSVCEKLIPITDKVSALLGEEKDALEILRKNIF